MEKSHFLFCDIAHRDFKIFKKAVLDFYGVQSLAEAKGLGRRMDSSFMRTVRSGTGKVFVFVPRNNGKTKLLF